MSLVQDALRRDGKSLNQAYKMRTTCAFGMERFWGEHLRLLSNKNQLERYKGLLIAETWQKFKEIMSDADPALAVKLPETMDINPQRSIDAEALTTAVDQLWSLSIDEHRTCLSVLTNLCDAIVWWTQRLKSGYVDDPDDRLDAD
jgi:predicted LPLAT superfamily acyltransferase